MRIKEITCINQRGDSITIGRHAPFILTSDLTTSGIRNEISFVKTNAPGAKSFGSRLAEKNLPIEFAIKIDKMTEDWIQDKRNEVFRVFDPEYSPIKVAFTLKNEKRYYFMADVEITPFFPHGLENSNTIWQKCLVQLTCGDPSIYLDQKTKVDVAVWLGNFEFPWEIPTDGVELGYRAPSLIVNVYNDGNKKTGMTIQFRALGTVKNPSLLNVNTQEKIKLDFTLIGGDEVNISTHQGNRKIKLIRNGTTIDIFNTFDLLSGSKFLQLDTGDNLFRYDADSGLEQLECSIYFTPKFVGV